MVGTFREPSRGRRLKPIHSIPYSVAQPLERGSNNYYSIIQGDYINLGSGAEAGIYEYGANLGGMDHWLTATDTKLKMELELYDKTLGETLFTYEPKGYTWWITGFDPSHPNAQGDNLTSTVTIHFDENTDLFEGFYNTYKNNKRWHFDGYSATIKW